MICPIHKLSLEAPDHPLIRVNDRSLSSADLERSIQNTITVLSDHPLNKPLSIIGEDPFIVLSWLFAAARTGHIIAITSTKEPQIIRDKRLLELEINPKTQYQSIPTETFINNQVTIVNPSSPLCILFTSGSSGTPKAVVHSFNGLMSSALFSNQNILLENGHRWLQSLSMWHIGGLMISIRAIFGTATMVVRNRSVSLSKQIEIDQITHVSVVPTQLSDLLNNEPKHILKAILVGGGVIPPGLVERAINHGWPVHTTYGMTELGSQLCTTRPGATIEELRSTGTTLGNWEIHINTSSEICVKGEPLFLGYWTGQQIDSPLDSEGFFNTGDLGIVRSGLLYPIGRSDKMFISGGENIYPEEIECVLNEIVPISIVVPVPNERYGMRPIAFIGLDFVSNDLIRELKSYLTEHLPSFKHPDHILPWPANISIIKPPRDVLEECANNWLNQRSQ